MGTSCLALVKVNGRSRLPLPPLSTSPFSGPPLPAVIAVPSRLLVTVTVVAMLCLQKRPSRLLVTGVREQRFQLGRDSPYLARVSHEVTRGVEEYVYEESNYSMERCSALSHEHQRLAAIQEIVLVRGRLNASSLMPYPRLRDVVAAESVGSRACAPVRLLPIAKVLLVEKADHL